ncbi:MAG: AAA family ATPase, partial [Tannerella sp.]|nr:AAA family ATPase [Tannerella sp.]
GKLGSIHKPSKELFKFDGIRATYYDSSRGYFDFDSIHKSKVRSFDGDSIALTLTFVREEEHKPRNVKLTFKIAGSDHIIRHVIEKTVSLSDDEEYTAEIILKTGAMSGGDYFVGIYHRNYLLAIESFYVLDPFHPKALKLINEMPGPDDLKQFLKKQINLFGYTGVRSLKTKSINWNMAVCGPGGTGKERMARRIFDMLEELGLYTGIFKTVEGCDLVMNVSTDTVIKDMVRAADDGLLYIRHAEELVKKRHNGSDVSLNDLLRKLAGNVEERHVVLILSGNNPEIAEMLSASEELGRLVPNRFQFDNLSVDTLMQIAGTILEERNLTLSAEAGDALRALITSTRNRYGRNFRNADWLLDTLEQDIIPRTANRVVEEHLLDDWPHNSLILPKDIPQPEPDTTGAAFTKLYRMIGLGEMKDSLTRHLFLVNFNRRRSRQGLYGKMGPLHMVFTGNPGTGKTTVAALIGEIYRNMGVLSSGHVMQTDRSRLVGQYLGHTEANTRDAIDKARGGVLFIDEAYALFTAGKDSTDFGKHVIETLLPVLGDDDADLIVILAGYPEEMERLLDSNPGLRSRFPYTFHFSDYTLDELMQIADYTAGERNFTFSPEALNTLEKKVSSDLRSRDTRHFGNARYVVRLLQTQVIPNMSVRLAKYDGELTGDMLKTILPEDIPAPSPEEKITNAPVFDEQAIDAALQRLDGMIGLQRVKTAIHNFVKASRVLNRQGVTPAGRIPLKWSFTGVTGTGKSTVAGIFAEILCAMHLLEKGHLVEVKAEEIFGVAPYLAEERLRQAMYRSQQGLLFIDGDSTRFRQRNSGWDSEQLRMTLAGYAAGMHGSYALIIAEYESPRQHLIKNLAENGVTEFDQTFIFDSYTADELLQILSQMLQLENLCMDGEATAIMLSYIEGLTRTSQNDYANARTMKLLAIAINQRIRIRISDASSTTATVIAEDVKGFIRKDLPAKHRKIGYLPG